MEIFEKNIPHSCLKAGKKKFGEEGATGIYPTSHPNYNEIIA